MTLTDETETSQQKTVADVTQKETPRSEIREGERERFIVVEETAISKAFGADNILRDRQGRKSIAIRAEDDEVQSRTHGLDGNSPGNELKELKDLTEDVKISEQETRADVTQKETPRSEIREGERERFIVVEETAISKAFGADNILRDRQGRKSIAIRAEDDEVQSQTHGLDGNSPGNELKELKDLTEDVKISEQETQSTGKDPPTVVCSICKRDGHLKDECPEDFKKIELKPLPPMTERFREILDGLCMLCYRELSPSLVEQQKREQILGSLERFIRKEYNDKAQLCLFGSSKNGFGFRDSDLDICMTLEGHDTSEKLNCKEIIEGLAKVLKKHTGLRNILPITTAKVPIVKFEHRQSGLEGDISLYNTLSIVSSPFVMFL
ncbi:terminal uridylyltransferase 4-like [Sinocyclocheilus grahami]|uniref:terminal uridylyltransferase 4-like n=1 Tax=Sinocyclocheilus grahami TaxID=75366 RepID=UPI0007AD40BC|nr:PREDICTED: terminal uridylyltransferase 4-like [Sinocyclocheilus grahami]